MKVDRLFNVLVLGGASLATVASACSTSTGPGDEGRGEVDSKATTPPESSPGAQGNSGNGGQPNTGGGGDAAAGADSAAKGADASTSDAACAKSCTDLGMPCCWMGDCTPDPSCKAQLCN